MAIKCVACGKFMPKDGVTCPQCKSFSHFECASIPVGAKVAETWRCGECQARAPKGRDTATPVRAAQDDYTVRATSPLALEDAAVNITAEFDSQMELHIGLRSIREDFFAELRSFKEEMRTFSAEMRDCRRELADFRVSLAGVNSRIDGLEQRIVSVEQRSETPPEISGLLKKVAWLEQEIRDREQESLLTDLEIGQLPEEKGENVVHTITVLAAKLGVALEERDVVFAERVGVAQVAGAAGGAPRARRIVVRLARRGCRDELLAAARVRRTLTAADAGQSTAAPGSRIFLNERLTPANRRLFYRVREECRRLQWRYSWTKRGRIFARQGEGKQAFAIQSEADLVRVFGPSSV